MKPASGAEFDVAVDEILVATGRRPNIEGLNLEGVGVKHDQKAIATDAKCRTNVPSVWAIGDVAGKLPLHALGGLSGGHRPAQHALPGGPREVRLREHALDHVHGARDRPRRPRRGRREEKNVPYRVFHAEFLHNDRAVCDGTQEDNFAKVLIDPKGKILGATIVHPHAGDLLGEIVLAKKNGLGLSALGSVIHAYPSLSEINGALARAYLKTSLTPGRKKILTKLAAFLRR